VHGNFAFLEQDFPQLEKLGGLAESYLHSDPNACLIKLGMLSEGIVNLMFQLDNIDLPEDSSLSNKVRILKNEGMLPRDISEMLYQLRIKRNEAAHEGFGTTESASVILEMAWHLAVWFMQTYGDYTFEPEEFALPDDQSRDADYERLIAENEALSRRLEAVTDNVAALTPSERRNRSASSAAKITLSEAETRVLIDAQLRQVGWEADSVNLRYSKGTRPQKGRNLAIAEYPTDSSICRYGSADYALYAGLTLVGVVEAKPSHKDIPSIIDNQCRDYSKGMRVAEESPTYGEGAYKSPFVFATNGRPCLTDASFFGKASEIATGTAQLTVPIKGLRKLTISTPSFPEQQEIVRILDGIFEQEKRAQELADAVERIDLMKKAILARAFRGELVPI